MKLKKNKNAKSWKKLMNYMIIIIEWKNKDIQDEEIDKEEKKII